MQHVGSSLQHVESFLAVRGLLSSCGVQTPERAGSVVAAHGLSSCGARALEHTGSVVAAHGLSCPAACGIFSSLTRDQIGRASCRERV